MHDTTRPSPRLAASGAASIGVVLVTTIGLQGAASAIEPTFASNEPADAAGATGRLAAAESEAVALPVTGVVLEESGAHTEVAVESHFSGFRTLVHIESEQAPECFEFPGGGASTAPASRRRSRWRGFSTSPRAAASS